MNQKSDPTDHHKSKELLIQELAALRDRVAQLAEELTRLKSKPSDGSWMLEAVRKNLSLCENEREKVQEDLRKSKERLRSLIEQAPGALAMFDRQMRYLSVSHRWLIDYKIGERDLTGLSHYDVFPEIPEYWKSIHRRAQAGEVLRADEDGFERADGSVQYLRWEVRPWYISPGDIGGIIIYSEDITERKQAEHEIEQSRARMAWVLEQVGIGTWFNELPFGHLIWDKQTKTLFFVPPDTEPTIELFWNHLHPDDHEPTRIAIEEAIGNRKTYSIEHRALNPRTGQIRWIRSIGRAAYSEDGTPTHFDGINYDITNYKQAEEKLLQLNESLDQQVFERTALADARSKQLQALAVELIEAEEQEKRRIAGLLHEDLQQLLAAARFKLESKRRLDPDLKLVLQLLEESISKARHMSRELSPAVLHHSDLAAAVEWLCLNVREQFGLTVELEVKTAMQVESAPSRAFIFRAIQELLFNIVKHSGARTAKVRIAESGSELLIMVSDPGKGFDPSELERFTGKTGLGLISLRERASYIGGVLTIESTPGKGSRFILRVPVMMVGTAGPHASTETQVEDKHHRMAQTAPSATPRDIRVLFADDHKVMRQGLIRLVAGKPGILVVGEAATGREALEKVRLIKPDVVVMDISMPEMDGIEATRHIKAELPDVRVICLSMHEDAHIAQVMHEAGAEASLSKTTSSSKLLKAIYGSTGDPQDGIAVYKKEKNRKPDQLKLPWG